MYKCYFLDSVNGWAAGDSGIVVRTTNGGYNWTIQNAQTSLHLRDMCFIDLNAGWVVGSDYDNYRSYFLKTTNAGLNWQITLYPDSTFFINSIYFLNSNTGFFGTLTGNIYRTTNSGLNWFLQQIDSAQNAELPVNRIKFQNSQIGFACGGVNDFAALFWKTIDGGSNWNVKFLAYEPLYDFEFLSLQKIIAVGGDYEYGSSIAKTFNAGNSWNFQYIGLFGIAHAIEFRTVSNAWMTLSISGKIAYSLDTGNTWNIIDAPDSSYIYDLSFTDSLHGWGVGDNGRIIKFDPTYIGIKPIGEYIPDDLYLYQNYPNPFNPVTNIKFKIPHEQNGKTTLQVFNCLGQLVITLASGDLNYGLYEVKLNGFNLPGGIYFYRLCNSSHSVTRRMILLK